MIGHFGTVAGYRAFVGHATAQKVDVSLMINSGEYGDGDPTPVIMRSLELMLTEAA